MAPHGGDATGWRVVDAVGTTYAAATAGVGVGLLAVLGWAVVSDGIDGSAWSIAGVAPPALVLLLVGATGVRSVRAGRTRGGPRVVLTLVIALVVATALYVAIHHAGLHDSGASFDAPTAVAPSISVPITPASGWEWPRFAALGIAVPGLIAVVAATATRQSRIASGIAIGLVVAGAAIGFAEERGAATDRRDACRRIAAIVERGRDPAAICRADPNRYD